MKKQHFYYDMPKETYIYITKGNLLKESKKENEGVLPDWMEGLINTYEKQTRRIRKN